jgi:ubiquinone/menaquinone biosynthesis C-methylase UbiE
MKSENIFKIFLDSQLSWSFIQGPVYNRLIWNAAGDTIEEMLDRTPAPKAGAKVLDIGSGPGYATALAARKHPDAVFIGVDYSEPQVNWAKKHLAKSGAANCSFQVGDAMDLPFEDNSFDQVMSIASIKHWPDAVRGLKEISRVLKPGCSAHIGEADRECDPKAFDRFARAFTSSWWVNKSLVRWFLKTTVFGQSYSCAEVEEMARKAGFAEILVEKIADRPFLRAFLTNP